MQDHYREPSPFNALPPVVVALALVLFGIECLFMAGDAGLIGGPTAIGWRLEALQDYAYSGVVLQYVLQTGTFPPELVIRFVTYVFVQGSFTQAAFVCVFLLALGKVVGEVFRPAALLAVFFGSAIGGAVIFSLLPGDPRPLVGGYPAVYGLIGAYTWLMWIMAGAMGQSQLAAFRLIAMLMGVQLLVNLLFGGGFTWVADVGGFATGFALSFVVSPGGLARLIAKLRR